MTLHDHYDLSILNADAQPMIVSFERRPGDKFGPAISHDALRRMRQVKLVTTEARGSPIELKYEEIPPVVNAPQLIFTRTGTYVVLVGENLRAAEGDFGTCPVYYHDQPRAKEDRKDQPQRTVNP